jgi:hypothetical protein
MSAHDECKADFLSLRLTALEGANAAADIEIHNHVVTQIGCKDLNIKGMSYFFKLIVCEEKCARHVLKMENFFDVVESRIILLFNKLSDKFSVMFEGSKCGMYYKGVASLKNLEYEKILNIPKFTAALFFLVFTIAQFVKWQLAKKQLEIRKFGKIF